MTTLTRTKQDGSPAGGWMQVGVVSDTATVVLWYGQTRQGTVDDLACVGYDRLFPSEDVSASIGTQTEFDRLAAEWKHETAHLSSLNMIVEHRAYQEIIGMGKEAIPMILQNLNEAPAQWFWALRSISRESPVRPEDRGDVDAMTAAWLEWGKRRHYV